MTTTHSPEGEPANDVLHSSGARSGRGGRRGGRCPPSRARQSATPGEGRRGGVHAVRVPVEGEPESHQQLLHHARPPPPDRPVLWRRGAPGPWGHIPPT